KRGIAHGRAAVKKIARAAERQRRLQKLFFGARSHTICARQRTSPVSRPASCNAKLKRISVRPTARTARGVSGADVAFIAMRRWTLAKIHAALGPATASILPPLPRARHAH